MAMKVDVENPLKCRSRMTSKSSPLVPLIPLSQHHNSLVQKLGNALDSRIFKVVIP